MNHPQRDSHALFTALGSIGDAVITMDTEGQVTFLNSVAESLTGSTQAEAVGQPIANVFRLIHQKSGRPVDSPIVRAFRGSVQAKRHVLIAKDGTEQLIADTAVATQNAQGQVTGVMLAFRNVAERRQAEHATQEALAYATDIIATLREPFVVLDSDLRVKTANRSFYDSFHVSKEQTEDRVVYDLGDGQWSSAGLRTMLEEVVARNHSVHDFEVEHSFPGLGRKSIVFNARSFRSDAKHPEYILLAIEDVTERKQAEVAMRTSEVRYRRLFETAQDAILILDADTGKIVDSNPFLSHLLGYSPEELLGKELWEIGLFKDIEANRAAFQQLQGQRYIRYEDLPLETKDGRHAYVEFVSNVYSVEDHEVIQCNIRDISERRRAEETLRQADRRKDEFLAILAHELRNPLAPLRNAVDFLRRHATTDPEIRWARDVLERQVQHLIRLVDDLLDISRFNCGKINLQKEPVALATVVGHAVEISQPLIDARHHSLEISLPEAALHVEGDLTRLAQALSNLLINAAKYTDERGSLSLMVEASGGEAALRVRDSGVGIAADMLPHVFEMFTQAPGAARRSGSGLGIGLTLVRQLVEMHGGRVEAYSEGAGCGSEFSIYLPLVHSPSAPGAPEQRANKAPARQVLIVDDNQDAAEMLAKLLRLDGHEVRTAYDGPAALGLVQERPPDVVLLDINLPGMDGLEVARRLRQDLGLKQALLVALTGYGQEEDRRQSQKAGFNAHMVKPVDVCVLESLLGRPAFSGEEWLELH